MNPNQTSAKIYQFPVRVRTTSDIGRFETKFSAEQRASQGPEVMSSSGWYHETAMRPAQPAAKT